MPPRAFSRIVRKTISGVSSTRFAIAGRCPIPNRTAARVIAAQTSAGWACPCPRWNKRQPIQTSRLITPQRRSNSSTIPPYRRPKSSWLNKPAIVAVSVTSSVSANGFMSWSSPRTTTAKRTPMPKAIGRCGRSCGQIGVPWLTFSATSERNPTRLASRVPTKTAINSRIRGLSSESATTNAEGISANSGGSASICPIMTGISDRMPGSPNPHRARNVLPKWIWLVFVAGVCWVMSFSILKF